MKRFEVEPPMAGAGAGVPGMAHPTPGPGRRRRRRNRQRPIEMLPTVVTLGNLFSGFLAIAYLTDSLHTLDPAVRTALHLKAVGLIFLAMVFDALDGKIARMMHQTSKFGEQVDSICDAVSFGAAPALLFKEVCEAEPSVLRPKVALVLAVLFLAGAVLRLARFNVETDPDPESHRWFKGLPTPGAASVIASLVYLNTILDDGADSWVRQALPWVTASLAYLMVSRIRYVHVASWIFRRKSFPMLAGLVFVTGFMVIWHEYLVPAFCVGFMISGPLHWAWTRLRRRQLPEPAG